MNSREYALKTDKMAKNALKRLQKWENLPKITKNDQKSHWYTWNMLQLDPPGQCHPEIYPKYLLSTQKWARKNKKKVKNGQK